MRVCRKRTDRTQTEYVFANVNSESDLHTSAAPDGKFASVQNDNGDDTATGE